MTKFEVSKEYLVCGQDWNMHKKWKIYLKDAVDMFVGLKRLIMKSCPLIKWSRIWNVKCSLCHAAHKQWHWNSLRSFHTLSKLCCVITHCTLLHRNCDVTALRCYMEVKLILTCNTKKLWWLAAESNQYVISQHNCSVLWMDLYNL